MEHTLMEDMNEKHRYWQMAFEWFNQQETELDRLKVKVRAAKANIRDESAQRNREYRNEEGRGDRKNTKTAGNRR
jgi:prefoldin subunit 5